MGQKKEKISIEELHKEIDLIQNCIQRMSNNSFLIKGWLITIIAGVVTLSHENMNVSIFLILVFATIIFWGLDAFFLQTEKKYRKMYTWMLEQRKLNSRELQYDLEPKRFDNQVESVFKIMFSPTLAGFYLCVLIAVIFVAVCLMPSVVKCLADMQSV